MKHRRHHNNTGQRSIRSGDNEEKLRRIAQKLGIPYGKTDKQQVLQTNPTDSGVSETDSQ